MNNNHTPHLSLPENLSDEAAATILAFLYELANLFESQYAGQLHRYYHGTDERQADFWENTDPPV